jgi:hypothetical protein
MMLGLNWLFAILLIFAGALAAYSGLVRTWPNFRQGLDRIMPYKEWFAIPVLIWGIWNLLRILFHLGMMTMLPAMWLIIILVGNAVAVLLGFILGFELIAQYLLTNAPNARRHGEIQASAAPGCPWLGRDPAGGAPAAAACDDVGQRTRPQATILAGEGWRGVLFPCPSEQRPRKRSWHNR